MTESVLCFKLKGWRVWEVAISNNYYNGRYASWSPRTYPVVASSEENAREVVLANADSILSEMLTWNGHNGRKILPKHSALKIDASRIGAAKLSSLIVSNGREYHTPEGKMFLRVAEGNLSL